MVALDQGGIKMTPEDIAEAVSMHLGMPATFTPWHDLDSEGWILVEDSDGETLCPFELGTVEAYGLAATDWGEFCDLMEQHHGECISPEVCEDLSRSHPGKLIWQAGACVAWRSSAGKTVESDNKYTPKKK